MADHLAQLTPKELADWYLRLAQFTEDKAKEANIVQPLAGAFLRTWVNNRILDKVYWFDAPEHLKQSKEVLDTLAYHREVILTNKKGRFDGKERWVGVLPRIQDGKWDMKKPPFCDIWYECLCTFAPTYKDIVRVQLAGTPAEKDLFTSLRGFQLKSDVRLTAAVSGNTAIFQSLSWKASASDRYDFDDSEGLTVPNPDYKKGPVAPNLETIKVAHTHATRLEQNGLACPYQVRIKPWIMSHFSMRVPDLAKWIAQDLTKKST